SSPKDAANRAIGRCKAHCLQLVLELLKIMQFRSPDTIIKHSEAGDNLGNPATLEKGGVYYYLERGDRLIDLNTLRDSLWQLKGLRKTAGSNGQNGYPSKFLTRKLKLQNVHERKNMRARFRDLTKEY
ncbi:hypothetical protein Tco_0743712, partial [Tanacetum coccineum]